MAKGILVIGYAEEVELPGSVWVKKITERKLKSLNERTSARQTFGDTVNGSLSLVNTVSVVADAYAMKHYSAIQYAKIDGVAWHVTSVSVERPRLVLRMGEVYNGEQASA